MRNWLFSLIFLVSLISSAQEEADEFRVIPSLTDWIEEINNWPDSIYEQSNLHILIDPIKDEGYAYRDNDDFDSLHLLSIEKKVVEKFVSVWRVKFSWTEDDNVYRRVYLANLHFKKPYEMYYLENNRFGFFNTVFDKLYQPRLMKTRFHLSHVYCHFGRINLNNPLAPTPIQFINCNVQSVLQISAIDETPSLSIENCDIPFVNLNSKMSSVVIDSSRFEVGLIMTRLNIETSIEVYKSNFGSIGLQGTQLPPENTYISFDNVENKLGIFWGDEFWDTINENRDSLTQEHKDYALSQVYRGVTKEELEDRDAYDQLIASYYKLLNIYKLRGELESYNTAYIEMRDKQTARTKLLYEEDPSFNRYFDYQINRFTRAFSDYGTRPAKAIVIFFQVVLAFSIFYFFFPSSWNTTNSRKLMGRLTYLGSYFKSKEGLSDLFEKETKDQYRDYEEFKSFMASSEKELPVYFQWLSKPLYHASVSRFNLSRSILLRTDVLNGKWTELPRARKAGTSIIIGIYLLFYLIYVLIIRCLNAITLSLNAFSTLGFGEIPTRGIARYVTIVQGFVGWFLLSIFLVSLIGQILN